MVSPEPVDYLILGHLTVDLTPNGPQLGGSASYCALMARALGLRVGIVTAWGGEIPLAALDGIPIIAAPSERSTTYENTYTPAGRTQYLRHVASPIDFSLVPAAWKRAPILHIAPVAGEVTAELPGDFRPTLLGLTPQGWMRARDENGRVTPRAWAGAEAALQKAGATVLSVEDVGHDEEQIERFAHNTPLLVVTDGPGGCRVFWHGDSRRIRAPQTVEVDATGAGDIFAACFFTRLATTRDPWEAARFAVQAASISITRAGVAGIPTPDEIQSCLMEILH